MHRRICSPCSGSIIFDGVNIFPSISNRTLVGTDIQLVFQSWWSVAWSADECKRYYPWRNPVQKGKTLNQHWKIQHAIALCASARITFWALEQLPHPIEWWTKATYCDRPRSFSSTQIVLILDEPPTALDRTNPKSSGFTHHQDIRDRQHLSIIFISHDIEVCQQISDTTLVLHEGKLKKDIGIVPLPISFSGASDTHEPLLESDLRPP